MGQLCNACKFREAPSALLRAGLGEALAREAVGDTFAALSAGLDRKGCWVLPKEIIASTSWLEELWQQGDRIANKPTLILWGLRDIAFREKELQRWQQLLTDARAHWLAGVGHFVQEEYGPEAVPIIAGFLR